MMGPRQVAQGALFYEFSLERHVPEDHLLRSIDGFVDLGDVRSRLAPLYSSTGRPSVDPELMIRMLLVGYCFGIRSERRLCEEVHLNLAYRWFCRLDLGDPVPDHSTFSKNRHGRFRDCDLFRHVATRVECSSSASARSRLTRPGEGAARAARGARSSGGEEIIRSPLMRDPAEGEPRPCRRSAEMRWPDSSWRELGCRKVARR